MIVTARSLVNLSLPEVQCALNPWPEPLTLEFEDGQTVEMLHNEVLYTWFFWEFHRKYPAMKVKSNHTVNYVLKGSDLNSSTLGSLLSIIYDDCVTQYNLTDPFMKDAPTKLIYEITNAVHVHVSRMAEAFLQTVDILDFIEIDDHPTIRDIKDTVQENPESVKRAYDAIDHILLHDPSLDNNRLVRAYRSKTVNRSQVMQCIGIRGFMTEVDGFILPKMNRLNYTTGMHNLYCFIGDTRGAAKSLYFSEAPLQDAEYFARRLQLLAMSVEKIHHGDCGSTRYLHWRVNGPTVNEKGDTLFQGDLKFMVGKYYLDEATGELKAIKGNEKHLNNTVIKLRSPIFCNHHDPHKICEVCFGELSKNVSPYSNLGHLCAATMTQQTSQSVLSVKHLDASASSTAILLSELNRNYFEVHQKTNSYMLKPAYKSMMPKLIVCRDDAIGLTDIFHVEKVENLNPNRISSVECVTFSYLEKGVEVSMPLYINQGNRRAVMSVDFLKYLKTHSWSTDARNNFVFDLSGWDFNVPIFKIPDVEYSFSDHSHQVAQLIESNMKNISDRMNPHSPVATLQELFALVNAKLDVNLVALEVIVYANMIGGKNDWSLSRHHDEPVLGVSDMVIKNRSLGAGYAYERQVDLIVDPASFMVTDRPDHVMDVFIDPQTVVNHYRNG